MARTPGPQDDLLLYLKLSDFTGGEISPLLEGRTDLAKYFSSCRRLQNMLPQVTGGATRRAGTYLVSTLPISAAAGARVTWNPADITGNGTLDGTLLQFGSTGSSQSAVRAKYALTGGAYYWEIINSLLSDNSGWFGLADATIPIASVAAIGAGTLNYFPNVQSGQLHVNGVAFNDFGLASIGSGWTAFALRFDVKRLWYRRNSGTVFGWCSNPFFNVNLGDPVGLVSGVSTFNAWVSGAPGTAPGPSRPVCVLFDHPTHDASITLIGDPADFFGPIPAGYIPWGPAQWLGSGAVLTNSGQTATLPAGSASGTRLTASGPPDGFNANKKYYYEYQIEANGGTPLAQGFINFGSASSTVQVAAQSDVGMFNIGGIGFDGATKVFNSEVPMTGHRYGVCDDRVNNLWWVIDLGGDPVSNRGGIDVTSILGSGQLVPASGQAHNGPLNTANFGATPFDGVVPYGFTPGWAYPRGIVL